MRAIKKSLESASDYLVYEFCFEPTKPFKQVLDMLIIRQNGGQWKFKLFLVSQEPEVQDTIVINSEMNKTT